MMTENEVWEYLEEIAKSGSILGLASMRELMNELSNVQDSLRFIHVAGTNGKGSVCAMISLILQQAGLRVGKYTSPAVFDRMEQYQVNGENMILPEFVAVISKVRDACERIVAKGGKQPTVFEVETAAAFVYFYKQKCQVVVLETGMGGETDATNIIRNPLVSVLTSISMDHMKFLGNDLVQIARMKAGIIKEGCPVTAARPPQEEVRRLIEDICEKKHAPLSYSEVGRVQNVRYQRKGNEIRQCFTYSVGMVDGVLSPQIQDRLWNEQEEFELSMLGSYQVENAVCAIETMRILVKSGFYISEKAVRTGLLQACWEGRFSVLCQNPLFIMDGAHNADAAKKLCQTLKRGFTNWKIIYIIGVLADKEHDRMLRIMLPLAWRVYTVTPQSSRAMDGQVLAAEAGKYHGQVSYCQTVKEAVERAVSDAAPEKLDKSTFSDAGNEGVMILAFGSLSYLGELREVVKEKL